MNIKEVIIRKSIKEIEKKLAKVNYLFNAKPGLEIINLHKEFIEFLEMNKTAEQRVSRESIQKINLMDKRNKELKRILKKQSGSKLVDEKVKLEIELRNLNNELYYIERSKQRIQKEN